MTDEPPEGETYIGDAVYASFDGWRIWLRTRRRDGDHKIALEPSVLRALFEYYEEMIRGERNHEQRKPT